MIIPVLLAKIALPFILRISETRTSIVKLTNLTSAVILLCKSAAASTFNNVQNQAGVLERVEVDHVAQRAVSERRAEHRDVILETNKKNDLFNPKSSQ